MTIPLHVRRTPILVFVLEYFRHANNSFGAFLEEGRGWLQSCCNDASIISHLSQQVGEKDGIQL